MAAVKQRQDYLDWICGLMIIQMIFGHILIFAGIDKEFYVINHILSWFMSWFFFKSGMMFRQTDDVKALIKKSFKRLIVPWAIFAIPDYIVFVVISLTNGGDYNWHYYARYIANIMSFGACANAPLWYLSALFLIKIGYNWLNRRVPAAVLLACCAIVPAVLFYWHHNWSMLGHTSVGCFFFILGHKLKDWQFDRRVVTVCALAAVTIGLTCWSHVEMAGNMLTHGFFILFFIYATACVILTNNIVKITPPDLLKKVNLSYIGRNSMVWLVVHWTLLRIVKAVCQRTGLLPDHGYITFWVMTAVLIVTIPLFDRWLHTPRLRFTLGE